MAALGYYRSLEQDLITKEDRLFNPVLTFTRSDGVAVNFTGKTILMKIYTRRGGTVTATLTSGTEIAISTGQLTFTKTFTELEYRAYEYELYNDTDKIGIMHGKLIVI